MDRTDLRDFLETVWARSSGNYVFFPSMLRHPASGDEQWRPGAHLLPEFALGNIPAQRWGEDIYFTPLRFDSITRTDEGASSKIKLLWADLDGSDPALLDHEYLPAFAWETSPGSYQAIWLLDKWVDLPIFRALNQAMTYYTGADKGGWYPSKVLRLPGTLNWKRAEDTVGGLTVPRGRMLWFRPGNVTRVEDVQRIVRVEPGEGSHTTEYGSMPALRDVTGAKEKLRKSTINLLVRPVGNDRSIAIWKAAVSMARDGISREEAFIILANSGLNKYRSTGRTERLWIDVNRAFDSVEK